MNCPKCGFEQAAGIECARCGVVFAKFHPRAGSGSFPVPAANVAAAAPPGDPSALPAVLPASPGGTRSEPPPAVSVGGGQRIKELLKTQWTFSQEELLRDTLTIFGNNVVPFSIVAILVMVPEVGLTRYVQNQLHSAGLSPLWWLGAAVVGALLMVPLATSAFTYGVLQEMRDLRPSIGDCLVTGLKSLLRVLLVAIFQGIAVVVGLLLCLLPGIWLLMMLYVAVPAAVEERLGPIGALRRSAELTRGYRLHIFYLLCKLATFQFAASFTAGFLLLLLGAEAWIREAATFLIGALFVGLGATATAVAYYRLRMVKEGVRATEMVSVFD